MEFNIDTLVQRGTTEEAINKFRRAVNVIQPHWTDGPWIAGGSIRRLIMGSDPLGSDVDVFFASETQKDSFVARMVAEHGAEIKYSNDMNTTMELTIPEVQFIGDTIEHSGGLPALPIKLQAVHVDYYTTPGAVIDSFDYTICQLITDGETIAAGKFTLWDLGRKRLVLHRVTFAVATMRRMLKYTNQGFYACGGMMNDFLRTVAERPELINADIKYID